MSTSRSCKKRSCQSSRPSGSRGISKWFSRCLCTSWGRSPQKYVNFMWVWVNTYRYIFNGMNIHKSQLFWGSPGVPGFWLIALCVHLEHALKVKGFFPQAPDQSWEMLSAEREVIEIEGRCGLQPIWDEIFLLADWLHVPHVRWLERVVVCLVVPNPLKTRFSDFDEEIDSLRTTDTSSAEALGGAISFPQLLLSMTKMPCYTVAVCLQVVLAR